MRREEKSRIYADSQEFRGGRIALATYRCRKPTIAQTLTASRYLMGEMWKNSGSAEGAHLLDSELMWELYDKKDKGPFRAFLEKRNSAMKRDLQAGMPRNVPWWEGIDTRPKSGERSPKYRL
jgi:hypothetical protein